MAAGSDERARHGLPYGYRRQGEQHIVECPDEVAVMRMVLHLRKYGRLSWQRIADALNEAGYRTRRGRLWYKSAVSEMWRGPLEKGERVL